MDGTGKGVTEMEKQDKTYQDANAAVIDRWIAEGWEWGKPIDHETYLQAQNGQWSVVLTPTKPVPREWFGDLKGKKLLGLASGGGQQMPVFTAAGAECTVLDYSEKQLESEQAVAEREGLTSYAPICQNRCPLQRNPLILFSIR